MKHFQFQMDFFLYTILFDKFWFDYIVDKKKIKNFLYLVLCGCLYMEREIVSSYREEGFIFTKFVPNNICRTSKEWAPAVDGWREKYSVLIASLENVDVILRKLDWDTITGIMKSVCPSKGKDWNKWGESIVETIRANTNQLDSPEKQVSIDFSTKNWTTMNAIIQENSKTRGGDWIAWAKSVSLCAVHRK